MPGTVLSAIDTEADIIKMPLVSWSRRPPTPSTGP